jgi:hypothetical protein
MDNMTEEQRDLLNQCDAIGTTVSTNRKSNDFYEYDLVTAEKIQRASEKGLTKGQIAAAIGFSPTKLFKVLKENEQVAMAIEKGRGKLNSEAMGYIIDAMRGGDLRAACFIVSHLDKMAAREEQYALKKELEGTPAGKTVIEMLIESNENE